MPSPNYKRLSNKIKEPAFAGKTDAEIATMLNAANPSNLVPQSFTVSELMALFSPTTLQALVTLPALVAFRDDAANQDRPATLNWLGLGLASGKIPQAEFNAAVALVNRTKPGPSWAEAEWGPVLTTADVTIARGF
jgi:hypothetical protein